VAAQPRIEPMKDRKMFVGLASGTTLCTLEDIADGSAKEFSCSVGDEIYNIFLQRKGDDVFAFNNACPHTGAPLNMEQGQFMEKSGTYLMCHTHGALFQLDDGLCVAGPCNGEFLEPFNIIVKDENVIVV